MKSWSRAMASLTAVAVLSAASTSYAAPCESDRDCPSGVKCEEGSCAADAPVPAQPTEQPRPSKDTDEDDLPTVLSPAEQTRRARLAAAADEARNAKEAEERRQDEQVAEARGKFKTISYVLFAGAGVSLIGTGVFGANALSKKSDLANQCVNKECPRSAMDTRDSMDSSATWATVSFVALLALVGGGVYCLVRAAAITAPPPPVAGRLTIKPSSNGIGGTF